MRLFLRRLSSVVRCVVRRIRLVLRLRRLKRFMTCLKRPSPRVIVLSVRTAGVLISCSLRVICVRVRIGVLRMWWVMSLVVVVSVSITVTVIAMSRMPLRLSLSMRM